MLVTAPVQAGVVIPPEYDWSAEFTSDHMTGGAGVPPFGFVGLVENEDDGVDFYVVLQNDDWESESGFVLTGAGDWMNFKFNALDIEVDDISGTNLTADTGNFNGDGGGMFHYGVYFTGQGPGASDYRLGPIVFTVADAVISDFISPEVVELNGTGQIFVADIISGQTGNTGLVDVSAVPIPAAAWLFGSGLLGLVAIRRRMKK